MPDESRTNIISKDPAEKTDSNKDCTEQKRDGSIVITNDNRNVYPQASQEERKKPNWVEKGTLIVLFFTFCAAIYAGIEAHRLAEWTKTAVGDAETVATQQSADTAKLLKISRDAADAAKTSAEAALKQATEMHDQAATSRDQLAAFESESHIRLRAYLSAIVVTAIPPLEVNKDREITTTFQAAGQTPAIDMTGWAASATGPYPMPDTLVLPGKETVNPTMIQTKITLTPNTFTTLPLMTSPLKQSDFDAIKTLRTHRLYVWGKMDFTDVFGCKRWITYCFTVNDTVAPPRGETCPRNNDMEGPAGKCPK